ncbi:hypothetical protein BDV96DRAFT_641017 [Lophiotrema nucula]|uniref:Uncharacterized protein n=1 Tax=Lophiotrema nucula TaxID=690887 RepID=A0A6A5ZTP5_9PLEO|nr:hypothetical protein BDV96DRAFT_641017 [Lophiotrema nucula]
MADANSLKRTGPRIGLFQVTPSTGKAHRSTLATAISTQQPGGETPPPSQPNEKHPQIDAVEILDTIRKILLRKYASQPPLAASLALIIHKGIVELVNGNTPSIQALGAICHEIKQQHGMHILEGPVNQYLTNLMRTHASAKSRMLTTEPSLSASHQVQNKNTSQVPTDQPKISYQDVLEHFQETDHTIRNDFADLEDTDSYRGIRDACDNAIRSIKKKIDRTPVEIFDEFQRDINFWMSLWVESLEEQG